VADLQDTLDAIAEVAVHRCGHCDEPLPPTAASPDFCGPACQRAWTEQQAEIVALVGYREPLELAAHVNNLVELHSPEVTPRHQPLPRLAIPELPPVRLVIRPSNEALQRFRESFEQLAESMMRVSHFVPDWGPPDALDPPPEPEPEAEAERMRRALELRRTRNTGPTDRYRWTRCRRSQ
jgi:hypothetical protein